MAEEAADPREVAWHPRRSETLVGHAAAEERLLRAHHSGRLHHAWLISGPRGIGKATLAYRFARVLLGAKAARQIAARSHPDLLVIERRFDAKTKKLKSEIAVDDAREATGFFARTAGAGGWRIAIVDSADDLNKESANALLKVIEEPPRRSVFLLVSSRPGALLRTIRSRTIELPLHKLSLEDTLTVLRDLPPVARLSEEVLRQAAQLSEGSPGRALELAGSKGAETFAAFRAGPRLSPSRCVDLAAGFAGRDSATDFAIFSGLLVDWIAAKARSEALAGARAAALAKAHDDIAASLRQTDALNLDRRQTVVDALLALDEALKVNP